MVKKKTKKKTRPKERKSTILSGKEKNSFVKAAGTGRAPRWRPDFEKKKSSSNQNLPNKMYKTRFPFDSKTKTIASNRNLRSCISIRCLAPQHIFRFFHFCRRFFLCLWQICSLLCRPPPRSARDKKKIKVSAMGYFSREILIH